MRCAPGIVRIWSTTKQGTWIYDYENIGPRDSLHEKIFEPLAHGQILLAHCIVY